MKKLPSILIIIALLAIGSNTAYGQISGLGNGFLIYNTPGGGARAAAMGGAFIALAEGEMAYSWNPAAMIYTDKTKFGIDFLSRSDKHTDSFIDFRFWDLGNPLITQYEADLSHTSLNYGGFSAPFSLDSDSDARLLAVAALPLSIIPIVFSPSEDLQLAVGGGYRQIFNLKAEYRFTGFDNSRNTFDQNRGLDAITLGVATKISEGIGFGWNMNAYIRGSEFNQINGENQDIRQFVNDNRADTIVSEWYQLRSTFSGFNMDFGLSADFNMVKAGVVVNTPFNLYQRSLRTYRLIIPPQPAGFIDRVNYTYSFPLTASFGLAFLPTENMALSFDYSYRPLSEVDRKVDWEQTALSDMDTTINLEWEDVNQYRIGAEYIIDAGFGGIPLRVGMRNEPLIMNENELITVDVLSRNDSIWVNYDVAREGSQITTNIFTFGTGLTLDRVWFDIGYQFGSSSYTGDIEYIFTDVVDPVNDPNPPPLEIDSPDHEYKVEYSKIFFSVGMYF
jgi:opacity protein-like surface antigen